MMLSTTVLTRIACLCAFFIVPLHKFNKTCII